MIIFTKHAEQQLLQRTNLNVQQVIRFMPLFDKITHPTETNNKLIRRKFNHPNFTGCYILELKSSEFYLIVGSNNKVVTVVNTFGDKEHRVADAKSKYLV